MDVDMARDVDSSPEKDESMDSLNCMPFMLSSDFQLTYLLLNFLDGIFEYLFRFGPEYSSVHFHKGRLYSIHCLLKPIKIKILFLEFRV
jgi:hypothetical protein